MSVALLDGDILVYWAAFACQKTKYVFEDEVYENYKALKEVLDSRELKKSEVKIDSFVDLLPKNNCKPVLEGRINSILKALGTNNKEIWLTGDLNYRDDVAVTKPYKGNRKQDKPVYYEYVKELIAKKGAKFEEPLEADDLLGIRSGELKNSVICTIDKDLDMIPGFHYNWNKEKKYRVSEENALYFFLIQLLTGDSIDNIPGVPGVGEKTAKKLVKEAGSVKKAFDTIRKKYDNDEYLTEQAILLWIKREAEEPQWNIDWFNGEYL